MKIKKQHLFEIEIFCHSIKCFYWPQICSIINCGASLFFLKTSEYPKI